MRRRRAQEWKQDLFVSRKSESRSLVKMCLEAAIYYSSREGRNSYAVPVLQWISLFMTVDCQCEHLKMSLWLKEWQRNLTALTDGSKRYTIKTRLAALKNISAWCDYIFNFLHWHHISCTICTFMSRERNRGNCGKLVRSPNFINIIEKEFHRKTFKSHILFVHLHFLWYL